MPRASDSPPPAAPPGGPASPRSSALPEALRRAVLRFDPEIPIERAWTPPALWYRDPQLLELERRAVLRRNWIAVGRADAVTEPGQYLAGVLLGDPYVVLRDRDGALRAFHNVCRHHGARMLDGRGRCEQIVCPYHGWTYATNGRLIRAPGFGAVEALERDTLDLVPIASAELGPLLLLCLDPEPPPLAELLRELPPELAPERLGELRFVGERRYRVRANWKVVVENYLDGGYHVPVLHRRLAGGLELESYRTQVGARCVTQRVAARPGEARLGSGAVYTWLHPGLMLNRYGPILDTNRVVPAGPEHSWIHYDFFAEPSVASDSGFLERALAESDAIQREDSEICARVQEGLRSSSFESGRYAARAEHGMYCFHGLLARALQRSIAA